jgi:two-component system, chemotaxis family, sensor histidine kinase and response regulator PixL
MSTDPSIREEALPYFLCEANDLLQSIEQELLTLREDRTPAKIHSLMRSAHTLKGAAATVGLETIKHVAHVLEDVFRALYNPEIEVDDEIESLLFEGYECLRLPLMSQSSGSTFDESDILNRAATIIARLQDKLGDLFDREAQIPTSAELGFDIVKSMFESGVVQRIEKLTIALATQNVSEIGSQLRANSEVFLGLAESCQLTGFGAIAQATIAALDAQPGQAIAIAQAAIPNYESARQTVIAGDRSLGGAPTPELLAFGSGAAATPVGLPAMTFSADGLPDLSGIDLSTIDMSALGFSGDGLPDLSSMDLSAIGFPADSLPADIDSIASAFTAAGPIEDAGMAGGLDALFGGLDMAAIDFANLDMTGAGSVGPIEPEVIEPEPELEPEADSTDASKSSKSKSSKSKAKSKAKSKSNDELVSEPVSEPVSELGEIQTVAIADTSTSDPFAQALNGLAIDSTLLDQLAQSASLFGDMAQAMPEPIAEPIAEPIVESIAEPIVEAIVKPVATKPQVKPTAPEQLTTSPSFSSKAKPRAKEGKSKDPSPTVRVSLDQVMRLDHLAGQLLTNQIQNTIQEQEFRLVVQEMMEQLRTHRRTLSDLQSRTQQVGVNDSAPRSQGPSGLPIAANLGSPKLDGSRLDSMGSRFDSLELDRYGDLHILAQTALNEAVQIEIVVESLDQMTKQARRTCEGRQRLLNHLRDDLTTVRMQPIGELLNRFPRLMRQLATNNNKPVDLILTGSQVLADKILIDQLYDSLLHILRNAFDHGIEPPEQRRTSGKVATGRIEIKAYHQNNRLVLEIQDDGRGIDLERVALKALDLGFLSATQVEPVTEDELLGFLFEPGFSTAAKVSDLSGRGVGLDVVKSQIESLNGSIQLRTTPGQGSRFTLRLPLSLTIAKLMICQAQGRSYAVAVDAIEQVVLPRSGQLRQMSDQRWVFHWGQGSQEVIVPITDLASVIPYARPTVTNRNTSIQPILILATPTGYVGLRVDQVLGEQELGIRPLKGVINAPDYIAGCSIVGDEQLVLVLDFERLLPQLSNPVAQAAIALPLTNNARPPRVLVVDDSLTQRQTLARTLTKAGYEVLEASDGLEATVVLQQNPEIAQIICDLEMPRMNGFEFLSQLRKQPENSQLPFIMLTSRGGAKYRQLAMELGANAFMAKPFLDREVLSTITRLLDGRALAAAQV